MKLLGLAVQAGVIHGEAGPEAMLPYGPISAVLRAYLRATPAGSGDPLGDAPLAPHLALLLPQLGPAPDGSDRVTLFEVLRATFAMIARRSPAVLFLDDLQWADSATLDLMLYLLAGVHDVPLLVLATLRPEAAEETGPVRQLVANLGRLPLVSIVELDREPDRHADTSCRGDGSGSSRVEGGATLRPMAAAPLSRRAYLVIGEVLTHPRFHPIHVRLYRWTGGRGPVGRALGLDVILVTMRGRRTGALRTVPLAAVRDGERWVLIGSNAGKEAVIAAVRARGFAPADDNEIDALALLLWAIDAQGGAQ